MKCKRIKRDAMIFSFGGIVYGMIEIVYRGYTHWTMLLTGGTCCLSVFKTFIFMKPCSLIKKCVLGSLIITFIEFICGCIVNIKLKMNIWDYSNKKMNFLGQICLFNSVIWALFSLPICFLCNKFKNIYLKY